MKLTSPAFADKLPVPEKYTCKGANVSPPLEFLDVPKESADLVLIVKDLDSMNQSVHWLVHSIPPITSHFEEGKVPANAIDGVSADGSKGYKGPCPKLFSGVHHYSFTLYALNLKLELPADADAKTIQDAMERCTIASSELIGVVAGEQVSQGTM